MLNITQRGLDYINIVSYVYGRGYKSKDDMKMLLRVCKNAQYESYYNSELDQVNSIFIRLIEQRIKKLEEKEYENQK